MTIPESFKLLAALLVLQATGLPCGPAHAQARQDVAKPACAIHDRWAYRRIDAFTGIEQGRVQSTIVAIYGTQIELVDTPIGATKEGPTGRQTRRILDCNTWSPADPSRVGPYVAFDFPLSVGKSWESDFTRPDASGPAGAFHDSAKVEGWETVTVPAGTFDALRVVHIERHMAHVADGVFPVHREEISWYAPIVKRMVKREIYARDYKAHLVSHDTVELIEYDVHPPTEGTAQTAIPLDFPSESQSISADIFARRVAGKTWTAVTASGAHWQVEFKADGGYSWTTDGQARTGLWRIEGDKLCGNLLGSADPTCSPVRSLGDAIYYKRPSNGEVVSMQPAP